eukprot:4406223-Pyramimonas_sp.AAC.1
MPGQGSPGPSGHGVRAPSRGRDWMEADPAPSWGPGLDRADPPTEGILDEKSKIPNKQSKH